jgi:hypothetical protein
MEMNTNILVLVLLLWILINVFFGKALEKLSGIIERRFGFFIAVNLISFGSTT